MKPSKRTVINKCDDLARQLNRLLRKNKCERCGRSGDQWQLHWAHIYGRRTKSFGLRWDMDNCHLFCVNCHRWQEENPLAYREWFVQTYGQSHEDALRAKFNRIQSSMSVHDYLRIQDDLKDQIDALL